MTNKEILSTYIENLRNNINIDYILQNAFLGHIDEIIENNNKTILQYLLKEKSVDFLIKDLTPEKDITNNILTYISAKAKETIQEIRKLEHNFIYALPDNVPDTKEEKDLQDKICKIQEQLDSLNNIFPPYIANKTEMAHKLHEQLIAYSNKRNSFRKSSGVYTAQALLNTINFDKSHKEYDETYYTDLAQLCKENADKIEEITLSLLPQNA